MADRTDKGKAIATNEQQETSNNRDRRPSFTHEMVPANLFYMKIPRQFAQKKLFSGGSLINNNVTLSTSLRTEAWEVKAEIVDKDVYLTDGWQKFAEEHLLGNFDKLTFKYNSNMSFEVFGYKEKGNFSDFKAYKEFKYRNRLDLSSSFFTSKYPYFQLIIRAENLGKDSYVDIPEEFSRKHLSSFKNNEIILLEFANQGLWHSFLHVSGGKMRMCSLWEGFAKDNKLKKGDVCIFELTRYDKLFVKIFRHSKPKV